MGKVQMAFEPRGIRIPMAQILPTRTISPDTRKAPQYLRLQSSIREIGLVEPLVVHPQANSGAESRDQSFYMLLDGHTRYDILKIRGDDDAFCLIARDDEAFTYNHKVNQIPPIQEHFMILKALENGVSEARIAATLNVDVPSIRAKRDLLSGVCPEAVELLKDRAVSANSLRELKRVAPLRQMEMAELMVGANNFSISYAKCLVLSTPARNMAGNAKPKEAIGMKPEDVDRMEREMEALGRDFRLIAESHGQNTLDLVLGVAYLRKLLDHATVVRYLSQRHPDILGEFQKLVEAPDLKGT